MQYKIDCTNHPQWMKLTANHPRSTTVKGEESTLLSIPMSTQYMNNTQIINLNKYNFTYYTFNVPGSILPRDHARAPPPPPPRHATPSHNPPWHRRHSPQSWLPSRGNPDRRPPRLPQQRTRRSPSPTLRRPRASHPDAGFGRRSRRIGSRWYRDLLFIHNNLEFLGVLLILVLINCILF